MTDLVTLYRQMYELTEPECRLTCRVPQSCCAPEYCEIAQGWAKWRWNVDVRPLRTDHPKLPFMGPTGCVLEPHLRPACTFHTCQVNGLGFKPGDQDWTDRYFGLRELIEAAEAEYHASLGRSE